MLNDLNKIALIANPYLTTVDEHYSALNQNRNALKGKTFRAN